MIKIIFESFDPDEEFNELDSDTFDQYIERARNYLIDSMRLPLSDGAWTSDKYADMIYDKAEEMFLEDCDNGDTSQVRVEYDDFGR
jgi:hypothetical protein